MEKCEKCGKPLVKENLDACLSSLCQTAIKTIDEIKEKLSVHIQKINV
jgi:hypothetical protein|tara:strand:- start:4920 stop:5063 length:144 start_codon:yes stop_codon:yes gene_type:complete